MNQKTRDSIEYFIHYWKDLAPPSPWKTEAIDECEEALNSTFPLDDEQLLEYFERLEGPEGCDFKDEDGITWTCGGGTDKSKSERILRETGLGDEEIGIVHLVVDVLGGHCDCTILLNAAERMYDFEEVVPA